MLRGSIIHAGYSTRRLRYQQIPNRLRNAA